MNEKVRTSCIDIAKLFFAYCVVAIHTQPFTEYKNGIIYNELLKNLFCIAVPYFFICSGFFLGKKLNNAATLKEQRFIVSKYFKRLAIPYVFWGALYFAIQIAIDVINEKNSITNSFNYYFHALVMSSPGGGLWYIQTILFILIIIYFIGIGKKFNILTICLLGCYIFSDIVYELAEISTGGGIDAAKIIETYENIFVTRRNFIFYGVFFVSGIHLSKLYCKHKVNKNTSFLIVVASWGMFICVNCIGGYALILFSGILILIISAALFCFLYSIEFEMIKERVYVIRKMSGIIYFTHFMFIYALRTLAVIFKFRPNNLSTIIWLLCSIGLTIYSIVLLRIDKLKKLVETVY